MIKQIKNLMLVAVAAMGFASCQNEAVEEITRPQEVVMTITADADDTRTYIDEENKVVKWSAGDQLKVIENSATYRTTTAINIDGDGKATFTVAFPANTSATSFTYNAIFPATAVVEDEAEKIDNAKVKVIIKEAQKSTATSFDPTADVLVSKHIETETQPTQLNMQFKRLVALGKMTLNNLPTDAKIERVIFTAAEGKGLAGRNYVDATTGEIAQYCYYGKTNTLTINYEEAISTRDIYFTCNPFEMAAGETLTVKAVCGNKSYTRKVEIPAGRSLKFIEGDLSTFSVDMANATVETNTAFADGDYAVLAVSNGKYYALLCDANGTRLGSNDEYAYDGSGSIMLTDDTANMRWTITKTENGYTFKGANDGYIAWYNNGNYAKTQAEPYYLDIVEDSANAGRYFVVSKADATRKLQRNKDIATYKYFAFYTSQQLGSLYLVPVGENTDPYFTINQDLQGYTADGDEIEFEVIAHNGFNAEVTATANVEWISFDHNGSIIYATAEPNEGAARSATITFSAEGYKSVEVTVNQEAGENAGEDDGEDDGEDTITVADFLAKADTSTEYKLTGKITRVVNTTYGNFDITDATGTVYVYGLLTPDGTAQKQWAAAGLREGDIITIKGKYSLYNGSPQIKNAVYVSHVVAQFIEATAVTVDANETTATIAVSANIAWTATCDANWVTDYTKSGTNDGSITVTMKANESEEERVATFTLTGSGTEAVTVTLTQKGKPAVGEVAGGEDDFDTISSTNASYVSGKTTAGWEYKNCAIFKGGTSDSSPAFKMIGNASNRALCMNGKKTAVGTITSPTLTTGCGTLTFNYGLPFSDTKMKFRVDIKQNGTTVRTFTVDVPSATKLTKYSHEEEINVSGDFQIVFTNLSPSNNSGNKDRTAIWDVEWTGYNN